MFKKTANEFRSFISRGNVIDLAVGVIIGSAFGKIVSSLISDILMPPLGMLISGIDFKDIKFNMGTLEKPVNINIGNFIQTAIEFLIIAFVIFLVVKGINAMNKKQAEAAAPPEPSSQDKLLTEIRDILKSK